MDLYKSLFCILVFCSCRAFSSEVMDTDSTPRAITDLGKMGEEGDFEEVKALAEKCFTVFKNAEDNICNPQRNEGLAMAMQMLPTLNVAVSGTSVEGACSEVGKSLQALTAVSTAFKITCGTQQGMCNNTCSRAVEQVEMKLEGLQGEYQGLSCGLCTCDMEGTCTNCGESVNQVTCTQKAKGIRSMAYLKGQRPIFISGEMGTVEYENKGVSIRNGNVRLMRSGCAGFTSIIGQTAQEILSLTLAFQNAKQCKDAVVEEEALAGSTNPDCSDAKNASHKSCICEGKPGDPGCLDNTNPVNGLMAQKAGAGGGDELGVDESALSNKALDDLDSIFGDGYGVEGATGKSAATNGIGGGGGPGAPGGGGGDSGGSAGAQARSPGGDSYKKNIMKGFMGSARKGSSGGSYGRSGAYGGDKSGKRKGRLNLKAYLPGGKKYKKRGLASSSEVSAANGPSIWDKVSLRYRKNKKTLINSPD